MSPDLLRLAALEKGNGEDAKSSMDLRAGQLWKLNDGYLSIVRLDDRSAFYKLLKAPDQKSAFTRLMSTEAFLEHLSHNCACLVAEDQHAPQG